jgi:hypothetical protein
MFGKGMLSPFSLRRGPAVCNRPGDCSSHGKFLCAISRRCHRRAARCRYDTAPLASLEDEVGTIRRRAPRRNWRDIHRIQPAKGRPRPDCDRVDGRYGIPCCRFGGSLGHSVDRSGCLGRAWNLGLCAPPRFKARMHTLKARLYTLMVSSLCAVADWVVAASLAVMWNLRV